MSVGFLINQCKSPKKNPLVFSKLTEEHDEPSIKQIIFNSTPAAYNRSLSCLRYLAVFGSTSPEEAKYFSTRHCTMMTSHKKLKSTLANHATSDQ